jgi:hypothetical protein
MEVVQHQEVAYHQLQVKEHEFRHLYRLALAGEVELVRHQVLHS